MALSFYDESEDEWQKLRSSVESLVASNVNESDLLTLIRACQKTSWGLCISILMEVMEVIIASMKPALEAERCIHFVVFLIWKIILWITILYALKIIFVFNFLYF